MKKLTFLFTVLMLTVLSAGDVQAKIVRLNKLTADYTAQSGDTLTGKLEGKIQPLKISIAENATVVLRNAIIDGYSYHYNKHWPGINCLGNATIILVGNDSVRTFGSQHPAIWIHEGYTLTIQGTGLLWASGSRSIGGGDIHGGGNIIINSGTIMADDGIGSGENSWCGDITINGGLVNARGLGENTGIGGSYMGDCGNITIARGATVIARKGCDAPHAIGSGRSGTIGTVKIGGEIYSEGTISNPFYYKNWDGNLSTLIDLDEEVTAKDGTTIYGTLNANVQVKIAAGATVTLDNATIEGVHESANSLLWAGITCLGDATIRLKGANRVKGFDFYYPGIYVSEGYTLTIEEAQEGSSLYAEAGTDGKYGHGAGIGGGLEINCGNIVIHGGTITANGKGVNANGIGSGVRASCGNILIDGGIVTATGGKTGVGIGCSRVKGSCGNITITDGVTQVVATRGPDAMCSIGKADAYGTCGTITIGGVQYPDGITDETFMYPPICEKPTLVDALTTSNSATITWDAPADQEKWTVCYHERSNTAYYTEVECTEKSCTLNNLIPDTEYIVWVQVSCTKKTSAESKKIRILTGPEPCDWPTNLKVTQVTADGAVVQWKKGCDNQTQWKVDLRKNVSGSKFQTLGIVSTPSYTLTDLEENTEYHIQITGICATQTSAPNDITFKTESYCQPVTEVEASNITQTEATLTWTAGDIDQAEWWVYLYSDIATYRGYRVYDDPEITFTNLKPEHTYRVRIQAVCDDGHSSKLTDFYTFETAQRPCLKVENVQTPEVTENSATITWERTGDNQDSYSLFYLVYGSAEEPIHIDNITGTSYTITDLEPGTKYLVNLWPVCGDRSATSVPISFTTEEHFCRAPRNVHALGTSTATEIKLVWEPGRVGDNQYTLTWKTKKDAEYFEPHSVTGQQYTIPAEPSTTYDIVITTACGPGSASERVQIQYTTPAAASSCKTPVNLVQYGNPTYNSFKISWTAGDAADSQWQVAYKKLDDADYTLLTATEKPFTVNGLEPETEYTVQVRTICGEDEFSNWTAARTITTSAAPCSAPGKPVVSGEPTHNSATITWTPGTELQTQWKVYYKASSEADYRDPIEVDETTYTFTDLQSSTTYNVRVSAICGSEESYRSNSAEFTTAYKEPDCKKVSNIVLVGEAGADQATLSWTAGGDEIMWSVEYKRAEDDNFIEVTTTTNPVTLTGLEPSKTYNVRIHALCGELGEGEVSTFNFTTAAPVPPCEAPAVALSATTSNDAEITITPGSADQHEWVVYWQHADGTEQNVATTTDLTLQLLNLNEYTEYEVWACAKCGSRLSDPSDKLHFTTLRVCREPKNVAASDITASTAMITWTPGDYDQTKFTLKYRTGAAAWKELTVPDTRCLLTGLEPATEYEVQIVVACAELTAASTIYSFTTGDPCEAPAGIAFKKLTDESATVTWTAGAGQNAWAYELVRVSDSEVITSGRCTTPTVELTNLEPETDYSIRVKSECSNFDESEFSAALFTTDAASACAVPTNGKASNVTAHEATITWTPGYDETAWTVLYNDETGAYWGNDLALSTSFEMTGLEPQTHYTVKIVAICSGDSYSVWSDLIEFTTTEEIAPCMAPTGLQLASEATEHAAQLTWTVNQVGQSKWILEYRSEDESDFHAVNVTALPYTLEGLQANSLYEVRVKADCDGSYSEYSSAFFFQTPAEKQVCPAPTDLKAEQIYNNAALITWTPGDEKQHEWWIDYTPTADGTYGHFKTVTEPQVMLNELNPETEYTFSVRAYRDGIASDYAYLTFTTTAATPCATPKGVRLLEPASQHYAILSWFPGEEGQNTWILEYRSEYEEDFHAVEVTELPYTLDGLQENTRYDVRVKALCGETFSEYTGVASFWTPTPEATCDGPSNVQVSDITAYSAFVTWTPGGSEDHWIVQYKSAEEEEYAYTQFVYDVPEITLIGLEGATDYSVRVSAICDIESDYAYASFTTKTPICPAPTDAALSVFREDGALIFWTPGNRNTSSIFYYKRADETEFHSVIVADNAYTLGGLEPGMEYMVYIVGLCGTVESEPSNTVVFIAPTDPVGPACEPPTSVEVKNISSNYALVTWTVDNLDYIDWIVTYKIKGSTDEPLVKYVSGQQQTSLSPLRPETEYEVDVYTYCEDHASAQSVHTTFTTAPDPCPNPKNVEVLEITDNSALVTWTPGSEDNLYWQIRLNTIATEEWQFFTVYENTSYRLSELTADTEYSVSLISFCEEESGSGFTDKVFFRTLKSRPEGIDQTEQESGIISRKLLINDHLYILRGEHIFTIEGQLVK